MALVGLDMEKQKIEQKIAEIQALMKGHKAPARKGPAPAAQAPKRKPLSVAARRRIAVAQKRRWAEHHRKQKAAKKEAAAQAKGD